MKAGRAAFDVEATHNPPAEIACSGWCLAYGEGFDNAYRHSLD
jgi:hypothetical protein